MNTKDRPASDDSRYQALEAVIQELVYYADLGVTDYFQPGRPAGESPREPAAAAASGSTPPDPAGPGRYPGSPAIRPDFPGTRPPTAGPAPAAPSGQTAPSAAASTAPRQPPREEPLSPPGYSDPAAVRAGRQAQLDQLRAEIGPCTRCKLCRGRQNLVFGEGDPITRLMFAGEGPGADEDRTGRPFVGRAGQLLDRMIEAMSFCREQVYIANVVKCRPPENRVPEPDESSTCGPFLLRQIEIIQPQIIVCLGATAAQFLFGSKASIGVLRGSTARCRGARLVATYHPAYLLRNPAAKKDAWLDLQKAMAILGVSGREKP